jgi:hypothetical protein
VTLAFFIAFSIVFPLQVALVWVLTTLCLWVHQQLVLGVKVRSLVCSQPGLAALSVAVSILSHVISRLAAVSFTVAWFFFAAEADVGGGETGNGGLVGSSDGG